jgi:hypothetical protein
MEFIFATGFVTPTRLEDDLVACGVTDNLSDIPILGAASMLALSNEGRRVQPLSQGDSRIAAEVGLGSNIGVSRELARRQAERISEESSRLLGLYGYKNQVPLGALAGSTGWWGVR